MSKDIHIILFYKYVDISSPREFAEEHLSYCKNLGVLGKVLVAGEGINGSVSGTADQIEDYKKNLQSDSRFSDIVFKEDLGLMHPFKKMIVRIKKEIVSFGLDVDLNNRGKHITPEEFLDLYNKKEEVIILDARNNYESKVGKFKKALTPDIENFREFPKVADMLKGKKDKKIVMYCTGGIRCEKASAYLVQQGFKDVSQLSGGILEFGKKFPDSVWEGKCFVFDKRLLSKVNNNEDVIAKCEICSELCDFYRNCRNKKCNKLMIMCIYCDREMSGCCSKECFNEAIEFTKKSKISN